MSPNSSPPAPLTDLSFHILLSLGDGEAHGYAIGKEIEDRSDGRLRPTTGALYQALRRLHEERLIEPAASPAGATDARRRYYRMTEPGRAAAAAEAARLERLVHTARAKRLYAGS